MFRSSVIEIDVVDDQNSTIGTNGMSTAPMGGVGVAVDVGDAEALVGTTVGARVGGAEGGRAGELDAAAAAGAVCCGTVGGRPALRSTIAAAVTNKSATTATAIRRRSAASFVGSL
jgi:hypothetical protein